MNASLGLSGRVRLVLLGGFLLLVFPCRDELKAVQSTCVATSVGPQTGVIARVFLNYWVAGQAFPVLIEFDDEKDYNNFMHETKPQSAYLCYTPDEGGPGIPWALIARLGVKADLRVYAYFRAQASDDGGRGTGKGTVIVTGDRGGGTRGDLYRVANVLKNLKKISTPTLIPSQKQLP